MTIKEKLTFLKELPCNRKQVFSYPHYELGYYLQGESNNIESFFNKKIPFNFNLPILKNQIMIIKDTYFNFSKADFQKIDSIRLRDNIQGDRDDEFNIVIASPTTEEHLEDVSVGVYNKSASSYTLVLSYFKEKNLIPKFILHKKRRKFFYKVPQIKNEKIFNSYLAIAFDEIFKIENLDSHISYNPLVFFPSKYIVELEWYNIDTNIAKSLNKELTIKLHSIGNVLSKENRKAFHISDSFT